jgi:hypothetical protein
MKRVIDFSQKLELYKTHPELSDALYDLENELSYYEPANPPFSKRVVTSEMIKIIRL